MWRFLRNDLATAWRTARVRLLIEITIVVLTLPCGLLLHVPQRYFGQSGRAADLAGMAASRARCAGSEQEREFYRREAAWYRGQSRLIFWRSLCYALYPGYGPNGRDEQSDAELTIRDLETRERLDRHGFGWSRLQWLADQHAREARESERVVREIREGKLDPSYFDLGYAKRELEWHRRMEDYYLRAASRPWEPLPDDCPKR